MEELEKEFVPYDRSLRLKAIGFDEPCLGRYGEVDNLEFRFFKEPKSFDYGITSKTCLAPTFSQAFRWFREKHDLWSTLSYDEDDSGKILWGIDAFEYGIGPLFFLEEYDTYEEAELACLDKLLEIVESKSE